MRTTWGWYIAIATATVIGLPFYFLYSGSRTPFPYIGAALLTYLLCPISYAAITPLRRKRPPLQLVRAGWIVGLLAVVLWLVSVLIQVDYVVTPYEKWSFGHGGVSYMPYGAGGARALAPGLSVQLQVAPFSLVTLGTHVFAVGIGWYSSEIVWPIWPLAVGFILPTWTLYRLRRARVPQGHCVHCDYDLTGNVSGRCPECGHETSTSVLLSAKD